MHAFGGVVAVDGDNEDAFRERVGDVRQDAEDVHVVQRLEAIADIGRHREF